MDFMGTKEAAERWNLSQSYITKLCRENVIKGAEQDAPGSPWRIPIDTEKPTQKKLKRGKKLW